jgi:hypothetical protein
MDKSTIVSIYPKEINEVKHTIEPGRFHLKPGKPDSPSLLVVGSSSWWKEIDEEQLKENPPAPATNILSAYFFVQRIYLTENTENLEEQIESIEQIEEGDFHIGHDEQDRLEKHKRKEAKKGKGGEKGTEGEFAGSAPRTKPPQLAHHDRGDNYLSEEITRIKRLMK